MRLGAGLVGATLLAACSPAQQPGNSSYDPANAASDQPFNVDAGPAGAADVGPGGASVRPTPSPVLKRDVGEPAVPEPGASQPTTSLAEGPFAPDSGQAAADVVQTYVALLEQGRIQPALRLWGDGGTNRPGAAELRRYRTFHANVGGPGAIEGAAGSRYVTVPVQFSGTLRNGRAFV